MTRWHDCDPVGLDFCDTAPYRFVSTVDLAITAEQLFEVLADASAWPEWATAITGVEWTTPPPRGVGTTRVVRMRAGLAGDEEFLAWDEYTRVGFRFTRCSTSAIRAFAEDYRVASHAGGCTLTWVMAITPRYRAAGLGMTLARPVMSRVLQGFLHRLRRYTDDRYHTRGAAGAHEA